MLIIDDQSYKRMMINDLPKEKHVIFQIANS